MSIEATTWAWKQHLPPTMKLVLMAICDCHNAASGQCNPSFEFIAEKACVSRMTAIRAVRALADQGYVELLNSRRDNGQQLSNSYVLHLEKAEYQEETLSASRVSNCDEPSINCDTHIRNRKEEPEVVSPQTPHKPKPQTDTDAQFEVLKAEYPRRKTDQGWGEARRAFSQALKRSSFETIVAGARAYAAHCKANGNAGTDYVHKLRTFLANDKWDDFLGQTEAAEWQRRLAAARRMASWDTKWGPMPGQPGCLAPAALLQPGDGVGWQIWIPAAA